MGGERNRGKKEFSGYLLAVVIFVRKEGGGRKGNVKIFRLCLLFDLTFWLFLAGNLE